MKRKLITKLFVVTLVGVLSLNTIIPTMSASAKTNNETDSISTEKVVVNNSNFEQIKKEVKKYLVLNSDGTIALSKKVPKSFVTKYKLDELEKHFSRLNEEVKADKLIINSDFTIAKKHITRGGDTYCNNYWWGYSQGYSYEAACDAIAGCTKAVIYAGGEATIAGATGNLIALIGGVFTGYMAGSFGTDMSNINSRNHEAGIVVDMNWALRWNVYSQ